MVFDTVISVGSRFQSMLSSMSRGIFLFVVWGFVVLGFLDPLNLARASNLKLSAGVEGRRLGSVLAGCSVEHRTGEALGTTDVWTWA